MEKRVVITGLGVVAPNGIGINAFSDALRNGKSGIRYFPELEKDHFRCLVGGIPDIKQAEKEAFTDKYSLVKLRSSGILYGCTAGMEAWFDAGLGIVPAEDEMPDWDAGCVFGSISNGMESIEHGIRLIDKGDVRKMGGRAAQQAMNSGISAYLGGIIGMGNQVTTNSSTCNTGTESIIEAFLRIKYGHAKRMLAGSSEGSSKYIWAGFDAMSLEDSIFSERKGSVYAMASGFIENPEKASAPMSKRAAGFVHGSGAGALVLESLESAEERGAKIYAEILGAQVNSGGARTERTLHINGLEGMVRCVKEAIAQGCIQPEDIDLISGHLTSSAGSDLQEMTAWSRALGLSQHDFPLVNAPKSMIGHCNGAAGSIELVACALQLKHDFVHPSLNAEVLQTGIANLIGDDKAPLNPINNAGLNLIAKASFAFGDVNSCIILKKWAD